MDTQHTVLHQALDYYPYGKVLRMLQIDPQRHRLQGNMHDSETGLEYFNARMLETDLGFFRSVDPLSLHPNQVNKSPYQAMWGNPILLTDPTGECPSCFVKDIANWFMSDIPAQQRIDDIASLIPGNYTFRTMLSKQDPVNLRNYSGQELANMSVDMASLAMIGYAGTAKRGNSKVAKTAASTETEQIATKSKIKWPSNDGFNGKPQKVTLEKGMTFDRYGSPKGKYASPVGTPATQRSLAPGTTSKPLNQYRVLKPFEAQKGSAAPWFGEEGGGTQYKFNSSVETLLEKEFIEKITP